MIELPTDLPADLAPLSWLLGVWEGTGVIEYSAGDQRFEGEFTHRVSFSHDGGPFLNYAATASFRGAEGQDEPIALLSETGFWHLARPRTASDPGPALLPPAEAATERTVDDVEALRTDDGFPLEVSVAHSDGTLELYLGRIAGPRIDIATDAVVRPAGAKQYTAASRMYGLVDGHLLWAWDIAAMGETLKSHASARLAKV
ncbi:FABP family protein [Microbacterium esteraromaticum]|uniref:FABP family protein n=1 Tax=Microbacterium esteraromaticum TaxID=57043 RepID=UPI001A8FB6E2|nr:FABP family protein [Microbacterium esteraromaticum]MBN8425563.1 FABP family protein [Microbacterium esteraromaticum]MCA1307748.1 FABP family protein [Microbacterium esteraromaticum]WDH78149.1 FABP family protein [Microbacterium esteraromaticum]